MSDQPQGSDWWVASDGKWYPPESSAHLDSELGSQQPAAEQPAAAADHAAGGQATAGEGTPAGWYVDDYGQQRWWDGNAWTDHVAQPQAAQATAVMPPTPPWGTWTWPDGRPIDVATLPPYEQNKKVLAGVLGILLGGFGVHKFVLGYTSEGVIQIVATIFTCGIASVIGLIEGIMYLIKSDSEFYWTYVAGRKGWF